MKTTQTLLKSFLLLSLLIVAGGTMCGQHIVYEPYDFRQVNADGDTLYYRITSYTEPYTVAVTRCHDSTYHLLPQPSYEWQIGQPGFAYPVYDYDSLINIPPTVTHEDVTYTVTAIDIEAFYNQKGISVVNLPSTIETIDSAAFYLSSLTEISLPENLQSIKYEAFLRTSISEIHLPQSLSHIGALAFAHTNISEVDLPSGVDTLRYLAFCGCPIEKITLPEGLVVIEERAITCEYLDTLIFPSSLKCVGSLFRSISSNFDNFTEWNQLKYVKFTNGPEPLSLGKRCLAGCPHLETLILSDNIVSFGEECFSYSTIDTMVIPQNVRMIPGHCFFHCDSLRSVIFPEHLDTISHYAFSFCPLLESIVLPNDLKYIGGYAFNAYNGDSIGVKEIRVLSEEPPVLHCNNYVFPRIWPIMCTIPCGTLSDYQNSIWGAVYTNLSFYEDCDAVEEHTNSEIRIYPNPVSNVIYIEGDTDNGSQVFIYDLAGKMVAITELSPNFTAINISHLPQGFYILKIKGKEGSGYGIKVCKQ